jgi:N-acyl homoserine lactone hydrolase
MSVEMYIAGHFTSPAGIWRKGDDLDTKARFPVPVYVIESGDERILVDTGLNPGAADDAAAHYGAGDALGMFEMEQEASIADQIDLNQITRVVMTHLHFDHAGGLALLPGSLPIVIQRREWEAGSDPDAIARNFFQPRDYEGISERVELVDGDHDLLGDGSVELLLTPGHTPGHQSVRIGERLVIGGDVTHYDKTLDDRLFPVFADDPGAQAASADRLAALREDGAVIRPGHDPELLVPGPVDPG